MKQQNINAILEVIRELPDITSRELYTFVPHIAKGTVSSIIHNLKVRGVLVENGSKALPTLKGVRSYPAYRVSDNPVPPVPKLKNDKPTDAALQMRIDELSRQVCELAAWKTDALARYPDLAVDPIVLKAREIVAAELRATGDNALADLVMSGAKDNAMLVKVTITALETSYD
jgi:hypothetical protein